MIENGTHVAWPMFTASRQPDLDQPGFGPPTKGKITSSGEIGGAAGESF